MFLLLGTSSYLSCCFIMYLCLSGQTFDGKFDPLSMVQLIVFTWETVSNVTEGVKIWSRILSTKRFGWQCKNYQQKIFSQQNSSFLWILSHGNLDIAKLLTFDLGIHNLMSLLYNHYLKLGKVLKPVLKFIMMIMKSFSDVYLLPDLYYHHCL